MDNDENRRKCYIIFSPFRVAYLPCVYFNVTKMIKKYYTYLPNMWKEIMDGEYDVQADSVPSPS
jgi:hypothetical protein